MPKQAPIYVVYKRPTSKKGTHTTESEGLEKRYPPMADSCWCMAKQIQYCKVKKKTVNKQIKERVKSNVY